MARDKSWRRRLAAFAAMGLLAGMGVLGCQNNTPPNPQADADKDAATSKTESASSASPVIDPLHSLRQSFAEATRTDP